MRIVALLAVRNEALYLARCLQHLREQCVETIVIDNQSTDASLEIARGFLGNGVSAVATLPYEGFFDLVGQLACKEDRFRRLARPLPSVGGKPREAEYTSGRGRNSRKSSGAIHF